MFGLMMDAPLMISSLLSYAARWHSDVEIVTRTVEGPIHRYGYGEAARRAAQLAHALRALGVEPGERVATLAWNTYRHFELYYAYRGSVRSCIPRIHAYIRRKSPISSSTRKDRFIFSDLTFVPILEAIAPALKSVRGYVILTGESTMPKTSLPNVHCYESLLMAQPDRIEWPVFDERTASSLCYTSGTTGDPKGVMYSHRSTVLHALSAASVDQNRRIDGRNCCAAARSDVPRQRLGDSVFGADDGYQARPSRFRL